MAQTLMAEPRATATTRPGAIILVRHGEPAISRAVRLNAQEYRRFWSDYETRGLSPGQVPPGRLVEMVAGAGSVAASTRLRSIESLQAVAAGRAFTPDHLFIEAPLPPPNLPSWLRMSPRIWGVVARFWWWCFDRHEAEETRRQAEVRAEAAAMRLSDMAAGGEDVVLLAHGFFNFMIGRALKRRGWRLAVSEGYRYWSVRRFELK